MIAGRWWGSEMAAVTRIDSERSSSQRGPLGGTPYNWFYMVIDHDRAHTEDLGCIYGLDATD